MTKHISNILQLFNPGVKYRQDKQLNCTMKSVINERIVKQKPDDDSILSNHFRKILYPCKVPSGIKDKLVRQNQELL